MPVWIASFLSLFVARNPSLFHFCPHFPGSVITSTFPSFLPPSFLVTPFTLPPSGLISPFPSPLFLSPFHPFPTPLLLFPSILFPLSHPFPSSFLLPFPSRGGGGDGEWVGVSWWRGIEGRGEMGLSSSNPTLHTMRHHVSRHTMLPHFMHFFNTLHSSFTSRPALPCPSHPTLQLLHLLQLRRMATPRLLETSMNCVLREL